MFPVGEKILSGFADPEGALHRYRAVVYGHNTLY